MTKFDEYYESFSEMVIPESAVDSQRRDMKMSFYSGAVALISCIILLDEEVDKDRDKEFNNIVNEIYNKMEGFTVEQA